MVNKYSIEPEPTGQIPGIKTQLWILEYVHDNAKAELCGFRQALVNIYRKARGNRPIFNNDYTTFARVYISRNQKVQNWINSDNKFSAKMEVKFWEMQRRHALQSRETIKIISKNF